MSRFEELERSFSSEAREVPYTNIVNALIISFVLQTLPDRRFLKRRPMGYSQTIRIGLHHCNLVLEEVKSQENGPIAILLRNDTIQSTSGILTDRDFTQIVGTYFAAEGEQILLGTKPLNFVETMEMVKEGRIKDLLHTLQETSYKTSGFQDNQPEEPTPMG